VAEVLSFDWGDSGGGIIKLHDIFSVLAFAADREHQVYSLKAQ